MKQNSHFQCGDQVLLYGHICLVIQINEDAVGLGYFRGSDIRWFSNDFVALHQIPWTRDPDDTDWHPLNPLTHYRSHP